MYCQHTVIGISISFFLLMPPLKNNNTATMNEHILRPEKLIKLPPFSLKEFMTVHMNDEYYIQVKDNCKAVCIFKCRCDPSNSYLNK